MLNRIVRLFWMVCLLATSANSQEYYAYQEDGSQVALILNDSLISIKRISALDGPLDLFAIEEALDPSYAPQQMADGFIKYHVRPGYDADSLVNRLRELDEIMFANPGFVLPCGGSVLLTETFVANFAAGTDQASIDSMNSAHGVEVLDSLFNDPYWLLLKITDKSDLDVLTMGNQYHESDLVLYSKAGMVMELELCYPWDEYWGYQWHFENYAQFSGAFDADIDLDEAFEYWQSPSAYITVAILDDGFAPHEDFPADRIIGGWDYFGGDPVYSPGGETAHGMAHMGIIGATTTQHNEQGPNAGVGSVCDHVRVIGQKIASDDGRSYVTDNGIALAYSDAVLAGARIISNEWACGRGQCTTWNRDLY